MKELLAVCRQCANTQPKGDNMHSPNGVTDIACDGAFAPGDVVIYPVHGLGKIIQIESQLLGGIDTKLFVISFDGDRMILRLPLTKIAASGLRKVSSPATIQKALAILPTPRRERSGGWTKRVAECVSKINSGNILSVAEIVRDLHGSVKEGSAHAKEQQFYDQALTRLTAEVGAAEGVEPSAAMAKVTALLESSSAPA